ncbi:hypothetical protein ACLOJK_036319 [Asimina triloba]
MIQAVQQIGHNIASADPSRPQAIFLSSSSSMATVVSSPRLASPHPLPLAAIVDSNTSPSTGSIADRGDDGNRRQVEQSRSGSVRTHSSFRFQRAHLPPLAKPIRSSRGAMPKSKSMGYHNPTLQHLHSLRRRIKSENPKSPNQLAARNDVFLFKIPPSSIRPSKHNNCRLAACPYKTTITMWWATILAASRDLH